MRINPNFRAHQVGDLFLLVPISNSSQAIFCLNDTARTICQMFESGKNPPEIALALQSEFPTVHVKQIEQDVYSTLAHLGELHLKDDGSLLESDFEIRLRNHAKYRSIPIEGSLELTFRCNLRCIHCYCVHCQWEDQELTTQEIYSAIDQMVDAGCLWLLLTGGEPIIRKDFIDIYLYAKRKGLIITVFTNGLLIDKGLCEVFRATPPFLLEMTLYGMSDETYYRIAGSRKGFTHFTRSCDLLEQYGVGYRLKTMIQRRNHKELAAMQAFARERGRAFRYDAEVHARLDGQDVASSVRLSPEEILEVETNEDPEKTVEVWLSSRDERRHLYDNELFFCAAGKTSFNIDPFGNMSMCSRVRRPTFSLRSISFKEGWAQLVRLGKEKAPQHMVCRSCRYIDFCRTCPVAYDLDQELREKEFCSLAGARASVINHLTKEMLKS